jgi:hypothetical protein
MNLLLITRYLVLVAIVLMGFYALLVAVARVGCQLRSSRCC